MKKQKPRLLVDEVLREQMRAISKAYKESYYSGFKALYGYDLRKKKPK